MSSAWLEIGLAGELHVRQEYLTQSAAALKVLYISDVHLRPNRSDHLRRQVLSAAQSCDPDVILLGGDLVDRRTELGKLTSLIRSLRAIAPVFAVAGNHDRSVGVDQVRQSVVGGGGNWIQDTSASLTHGSRTISISGPIVDEAPMADVRILCAHNPRIWKRKRGLGFDLVLAGHLHGCQVVVFEYRDRLFPGAWFYPYTYLSHQDGRSRLVVSRGVSDLIPIRWRCPREVVLCHV